LFCIEFGWEGLTTAVTKDGRANNYSIGQNKEFREPAGERLAGKVKWGLCV
jgi:hypothetical protein